MTSENICFDMTIFTGKYSDYGVNELAGMSLASKHTQTHENTFAHNKLFSCVLNLVGKCMD